MKDVKECSISGIAFTLETEAYDKLETYLSNLRRYYGESPDGTEIVADIEARIAELILTEQENTRIVQLPLIAEIIRQMGSPEDISEKESEANAPHATPPRIPRRLYRDTENAKLGGVCAGLGRYFDLDPVWIRLGLFLPIALSSFGWFPLCRWMGPLFGNLFGFFVIGYLIMWYAVPTARTARQRLEMNGERISAQSIRETTAAFAPEPNVQAQTTIAEAVSVFGKVVLILLKLLAGLIVFGLIMLGCALMIGLFAIVIGGHDIVFTSYEHSLWVPVLGIFIALIPTALLIYVLMCLIASRKPEGKIVLVTSLCWIASIIACSMIAIRENVDHHILYNSSVYRNIFEAPIEEESEMTDLEKLLDKGKPDHAAPQPRKEDGKAAGQEAETTPTPSESDAGTE